MRSMRPLEYPLDRCVTGPHAGRDSGGQQTLYYRCELCKMESQDPLLLRGCWFCDRETGWR
jgi:hypothetical protein